MTARYVGVVFLAVGFFAGLLVPRGANSDISRDSGDRDEPGRLVTERRTSEPRMEGGAGVVRRISPLVNPGVCTPAGDGWLGGD